MPTPPTTCYWFVFMFRARPWSPPEGVAAPAGEAWEAVCVPGKLVACGSSKAEADKNLEAMVRASWAVHRGGSQGWWDEVKAGMDAADKALCSEFFMTMPEFKPTANGMPTFRSDPGNPEHAQLATAIFAASQTAGCP